MPTGLPGGLPGVSIDELPATGFSLVKSKFKNQMQEDGSVIDTDFQYQGESRPVEFTNGYGTLNQIDYNRKDAFDIEDSNYSSHRNVARNGAPKLINETRNFTIT